MYKLMHTLKSSAELLRRLANFQLEGPSARFSEAHDLDRQWQLICPYLPSYPCWVLDIGSNDGDACRRVKASGHYALGIEISSRLVSHANKQGDSNVAYMNAAVSPELLPKFDVIFMLSVAHRLWAFSGPRFAEACIARAFEKSDILFFFEGVARHARYCDKGAPPPPFSDEDLEAALEWHLDWLQFRAPEGWRIKYLGEVQTLNGRTSRLLFVASSKELT